MRQELLHARVSGSPGARTCGWLLLWLRRHGRSVRRKVCPEPMAPWPAWMRDLWLGPAGRDHGEDGLVRMAARKYSRQLNCALSLASQVSG